MDDYSQYFSALQSAQLATQIANIGTEQKEEQRQAIAPIGELISTEGIKEGISSTIETAKEMALSKAKDLASQAMKKAGIDDETIQSIISGNVKEAIVNKAQSLIGKVKTTVEDTVQQARETAEGALQTAQETAQNTATNTLDVIQNAPSEVMDHLSTIHDTLQGATTDLANNYASRFGNEFEDASDLLEGTRPLYGSLRPPQIDLSMQNLTEGTPLSDMIGRAIPVDLGNAAEDALGSLNTFEPTIANTISGIASNASNVVGATTQTLSGIASTAAETVSGLAGQASSAITGAVSSATDAISAVSGVASAAADAGEAAAGIASIGADAVLGPLGILVGLGAGIASLVESLKKPHEMEPVNSAAQFL